MLYETGLDTAQMDVRVCTCDFCRKHGAETTSDPKGRLRLMVYDSSKLNRYRFGLRTADYLICHECGVYIGALLAFDDKCYGTVNTRVFQEKSHLPQKHHTVSYDGEHEQEREVRRKALWTPAEILFHKEEGA
ncbi:MAG: hypothetical protein J0L97_03540 [Alphaproteobacteria bacterium]|nr:hypothetical protein [Alphaproteobacteria bacterium]